MHACMHRSTTACMRGSKALHASLCCVHTQQQNLSLLNATLLAILCTVDASAHSCHHAHHVFFLGPWE